MKATLKQTILLSSLVLFGCSKLDDYMLGKDNTPAPANLTPVTAKVKVTENWKIPVGSAKKVVENYFKLKPIVIGEMIYTAHPSGIVEAIDKNNGKIKWSKQLSSGIVSGPNVSNGYVIVSTDVSTLIALNQTSGLEVWHTSVSGDVLAKPVIAQNKVIAKTIDGNLYALSLKDGTKLWMVEHGAPSLILKASSSPVLVNNLILVGYADGKMDAVDINTGQMIWQKSIAYASGASDVERLVDIDADPIIQGEVAILASYQGYLGAFSLTTGEYLWRKPASTFKNLALVGNSIIMTDSKDIIWSVNKQNGQVYWKQPALKARGLTEPVVMNNKIIVGDKTGMLHVLSVQNGEFLSRMNVGQAITIAPTVTDNKIYVMTTNGQLSQFTVG